MNKVPTFLACGLLAACASPPPPPRPALDLGHWLALSESEFPGASALLRGFAAPDDDPSMRIGDAALLGLEVMRAGLVERHLLMIEVQNFPGLVGADGRQLTRQSLRADLTESTTNVATGVTSRQQRHLIIHSVRCRLVRADADGAILRDAEVTLFEEPLGAGFWAQTYRGADQREADLTGALTMSLQDMASGDGALQELLFRVVDKPSVWSVATNLGVKVNIVWGDPGPGSTAVAEAAAAIGSEVRTAKLDLSINGQVAAFATLLVSKPAAATRACGGLVGAIVQNAADPTRLLVAKLLATRRGR